MFEIHKLITLVSCIGMCSVFYANTPPMVTNVTVSQRTDGSKKVDIRYDLWDNDGDKCTVSVQVSNDGGSTWTVSAVSFTGAVGPNIARGTNKQIVWDAGKDLPGAFGSNYRIKVAANDMSTLISYFKFDCTSGPVIDEQGRNHAVNSGAARGIPGLFNTCYDFSGANNNYVEVLSFEGLVNKAFTVSMWIYVTSAEQWDNVIEFWVSNNANIAFRLQFSTVSSLMLELYNNSFSSYWNPSVDYSEYFNKWTEIRFSISSTAMELHLNGIKKIETPINFNLFPNDPILIFGNHDSRVRTRALNGKIDEVKIWLDN